MNKVCNHYTFRVIQQLINLYKQQSNEADCEKDDRVSIKKFLRQLLKALRLHEGSSI